MKHGFLGSAA